VGEVGFERRGRWREGGRVGCRERRMEVGMVVEGRVSVREKERRRHMEERRFVVGRERRRRRDRMVGWSSLAEVDKGYVEERRS